MQLLAHPRVDVKNHLEIVLSSLQKLYHITNCLEVFKRKENRLILEKSLYIQYMHLKKIVICARYLDIKSNVQ